MHKIILFSLFIILSNNVYGEMIKPDPSIGPKEVISIQLKALQKNNLPFDDAGIEQTWEFAHPNNKIITGPLDNFKQMIYSENYKILISHENNEVTILKETDNISIYKVFILSNDKKKYYYIWQVEKVLLDGYFKNCWMTTNVLSPKYLGDVIWAMN